MDRLWQSLVVLVALALTAGTSSPSVSDLLTAERTRLAVTASATPTASPPAPTVTQPNVQADEPPSVAPSPTPIILCQVCVLIDGEWQWLDECTRLYYYGKPCAPTPAPLPTAAEPATAEPTATVGAYP